MQKFLSLIIIIILVGLFSFLLKSSSNLIDKQNLLTENKCKEISYEKQKQISRENLEKFSIKLKIDEERKWKKNIISDQIKSLQNKWNFYAYERNNQRVKAKLYLYLKNDLICYYNAKIRAHGDLGDHRRGSKLPSLNVNLSEGNLFGITKFILFRPSTRKYESEIFGANLLRELNFLSPRTMMVDVLYNNNKSKFIFQEKIVKEFIEELDYVENPLFEADERFVFKELASGNDFLHNEVRKLQKSKLINKKITLKDNSHLRNSIFGLSILNEFKLKYFSNLSPYWIMDYYSINKKLYPNKNYFTKVPSFDSLLYVMNGTHGLASDERRFLFDPINEIFNPIYYDGDFEIFDKDNNFTPKFNYETLNDKIDKVSYSFIDGADDALRRLEKLNIDIFYDKLIKYGSKLKLSEIKKATDIIRFRLKKLQNLSINNIDIVDVREDFYYFNSPNYVSDIKRKLIFSTNLENKFIICDIYGANCKNIILDQKQISNLLSQELKISDYEIVFAGKKFPQSYNDFLKKNSYKTFKDDAFPFNKNNLMFYGDITYKFSNEKKEILFEKNNIEGRVIFNNVKISDWKIYFVDKTDSTNKKNKLKNFNGLTGCLNFIDSNLNNVNIQVDKSKCEDALNLIRSEGTINNIFISNSISDGLDVDFSNLKIKKLKSINSKNDCADFSYGVYEIENIIVENCGDKGISIGENSYFKNILLKVIKSKTGIASKDSSRSIFNNVEINSTDTCVRAYNKKQEFSGGFISIVNLMCKNYIIKTETDKVSKILITNES